MHGAFFRRQIIAIGQHSESFPDHLHVQTERLIFFFISFSDEFKMLVSGEAKASVEKFLEDEHTFEEYTNVSDIIVIIIHCSW